MIIKDSAELYLAVLNLMDTNKAPSGVFLDRYENIPEELYEAVFGGFFGNFKDPIKAIYSFFKLDELDNGWYFLDTLVYLDEMFWVNSYEVAEAIELLHTVDIPTEN